MFRRAVIWILDPLLNERDRLSLARICALVIIGAQIWVMVTDFPSWSQMGWPSAVTIVLCFLVCFADISARMAWKVIQDIVQLLGMIASVYVKQGTFASPPVSNESATPEAETEGQGGG